jgi:hypothetical protein
MSYPKKKKIQRKTGCCNFIASTTDSTKLEMGIGPAQTKVGVYTSGDYQK